MLGAGYDDEGELTDDDREFLQEYYRVTIEAVPGIVDRHRRGLDMGPTIDRIIHYSAGPYWYAFVTVGEEDDTRTASWRFGDTIDHCGDCSTYAGMGPQPMSYWRDVAIRLGHYPQSPALSCTGLHCDCTLD